MPEPAEIVTSEELLEDIRRHATDLDVPVFVCVNCDGLQGAAMLGNADGDPEGLIVISATPDTLPVYLIALHELGHRADPHFNRRLKLDREVFAWRWALEHALIDPGPEGWAVIRHGLESYTIDRRHRQTPAFLTLLEEARTNARYEAP